MIEYFNRICQIIANHPVAVSVSLNLFLGLILFVSLWFPQKFINRELRKNRKSPINKFDKVLILISGLIFSVVICIVGAEVLSNWYDNIIPKETTSIVVTFSVTAIILRSLVQLELINKAEIPSHLKIYRIAAISLLLIATFNVLSVKFTTNLATIFSYITLSYYFIEAYLERKTIGKCFTILHTKEYSIGAKLVDLINRKFTYVVLLGMFVVPLFTKRVNIHHEVIFYRNVLSMFCVWATMVVLQIISSSLVNQFIKKLTNLEEGKSTKKSAHSRRRNLLWICDVLVISFYLSIVGLILWLMGINVEKYILHDTLFTVGLTIFATILLYNAFKEFTDALIDGASPIDHEKILTFMPLVTVIFNLVLICASILLVLSQIGISTAPLLASFTAFWGLVMLSAKDIFKGFLQGIILLSESNFYLGDYITVNGQSGTVTKISTRTLTIRSTNGDDHAIPYHTIGIITNHSRDFFLHNESLLISPNSDTKKACELLSQVVNQLKTEEPFSNQILGDIIFAGVKPYSADGIQICWLLKTTPITGRFIQLEIYKRLFPLLQKENIRIPYRQEYTERLITNAKVS